MPHYVLVIEQDIGLYLFIELQRHCRTGGSHGPGPLPFAADPACVYNGRDNPKDIDWDPGRPENLLHLVGGRVPPAQVQLAKQSARCCFCCCAKSAQCGTNVETGPVDLNFACTGVAIGPSDPLASIGASAAGRRSLWRRWRGGVRR